MRKRRKKKEGERTVGLALDVELNVVERLVALRYALNVFALDVGLRKEEKN